MLLYFRFFYTCATLIIAFTSAGECPQLGGRDRLGEGVSRTAAEGRAPVAFSEMHDLKESLRVAG